MSERSAESPNRESSRRTASDSGPRGPLHELGGVGGERRALRRRDHGLTQAADGLRQDPAAAGVELRQDVVEQEQRRRGKKTRLRQEKREERQPLLALRAEP